MKEKLFNDLGLDNGEDLLKKFNLSNLIEIDKKDDEEDYKKEEEKEKSKKNKKINENI